MLDAIKRIISKGFFSGVGFGVGLVVILGLYFLVQAVAPGTVKNPTFGPTDDDVSLAKATMVVDTLATWGTQEAHYCDFNMVTGATSCDDVSKITVVSFKNPLPWVDVTNAMYIIGLSNNHVLGGRTWNPELSTWEATMTTVGATTFRITMRWNENSGVSSLGGRGRAEAIAFEQ